jgi:Animal haem peroxidase
MPSFGSGRNHGGVRGANLSSRSLLFGGSFGRIFRTLPPAEFSNDAVTALGQLMTAEGEDSPTRETEVDNEENQGISAGYTYLGQFIDHDLTFDPASSLQKQNDPDAVVDYRTPRFDLDNIYGRGPNDQPYLYESDGIHLQLGRKLTGNPADENTRDVPRHTSESGGYDGRARALIGDPRNDENVIVSQLQATFLRFHNKVADEHAGAALSDIQRLVRWHFQWIVLHDFLPTIVGQDMVHAVLPHLESGKSIFEDKPRLNFFHYRNEAFIPIEFSAAAYRFGHSMVRPIYRLNTTLGKNPPPKDDPVNGRLLIFHPEDDAQSLNGFRAFPANWAIDWSLFFDMGDKRPNVGFNRLQPAYKIDTSLVNPLGTLPKSVASDVRSLAARNLMRGVSMGLPSGQDVARAMGLPVISDDRLKVGKATEEDSAKNKRLVDIPKVGKEFEDNAPLWYYVLAEAQQQFKTDNTPIRLGPVGGRIVTETFVGLLLADSYSYLSQDPGWAPDSKRKFDMSDLIAKATAGSSR